MINQCLVESKQIHPRPSSRPLRIAQIEIPAQMYSIRLGPLSFVLNRKGLARHESYRYYSHRTLVNATNICVLVPHP